MWISSAISASRATRHSIKAGSTKFTYFFAYLLAKDKVIGWNSLAVTNCGRYSFQNAHCLSRGPRPV